MRKFTDNRQRHFMQCIVCNASAEANYCQQCGNKVNASRLTFKSVFTDFYQRVFGFESRFGHTLIDLTVAPGKVVKAYINGNRIQYMSPVGYLFWLVTVYMILLSLFDIQLSDLVQTMATVPDQPANREQVRQTIELQGWIQENFRAIPFIMIPFMAFFQMLLFRKSGFNYIEHAVVALYGMAHPYIFGIIVLLVYQFAGLNLQIWLMLVTTLYICFICHQVYAGGVIVNFLKGILAQILAYVVMIFLAVVILRGIIVFFPDLIGLN